MAKKNKKKNAGEKAAENSKKEPVYTNKAELNTEMPGKKRKNRLFDFE